MNVNDMIAELQDHGFTDQSSNRLLGFLNDAQYDVCSREPWPFLEKTIDLTFSASSDTASNFPSDFSKALAVINPVTGQVLEPRRLEDITKSLASSLSLAGDPIYYFFIAGALHVWPTPASTTLRMRYLCVPAAMDTVTITTPTVPQRHARVIVLGALVKAYLMEDDSDLASYFGQQFESRLATMRQDLWMQQYDRTDMLQVFVDYDDWDDPRGQSGGSW